MASFAKMVYLAKMTEKVIKRQNRHTVNKYSNEMAKGPYRKWQFWQKWHIWRKWRKWRFKGPLLASNLNLCHIPWISPAFWRFRQNCQSPRGHFWHPTQSSTEAGDFSPLLPWHAFLDISFIKDMKGKFDRSYLS